MKTISLKDLTEEECLQIASIVRPDIKWKVIKPYNEWEGFDLIDEDSEVDDIARFIFQIDYRPREIVKGQSRFRFYEEREEEKIPEDKLNLIHKYLCDTQFICIQTGTSCGMPCYDGCPVSKKIFNND